VEVIGHGNYGIRWIDAASRAKPCAMRPFAALILLAPALAAASPSLDDYLALRVTPDRAAVPAAPLVVSLRPDGPPLARVSAMSDHYELSVVDVVGERPRVLLSGNGVVIAAYVDPATLAPLTTAHVRLAAGAGGIGVDIRPGIPVVLAGNVAKLADGEVIAEGSIDRSKVGKVFSTHADKGGWTQADESTISPDAAFFDRPGGRAFAHLHGMRERGLAHRLGKTERGYVLVSYIGGRGTSRVTGWVAEREIAKAPEADANGEEGGVEGGVMGGIDTAPSNKPGFTGLRRGTRLYDAPNGALVGLATEDVALPRGKVADGWRSWSVVVDGLAVELWTKP
jgi:hypothetical protein